MQGESIVTVLIRTMRDRGVISEGGDLTGDTDLRGAGYVASMGMLAVLAILEELGATDVTSAIGELDQLRTLNHLISRFRLGQRTEDCPVGLG